MEMVAFDPMEQEDIDTLKKMIQNHFDFTKSDVAELILKDWTNQLKHFVKVMPTDYKAVLLKRKQQSENKGVLV
jgi:glutamate synthase (NADPH/NADH) large chain